MSMMFAGPAGPVARADLRTVLKGLGLTSGLKLVLDAGDEGSWPGSGQKWLDVSGGGYDFFRGDDGTSESNDPSFNGTSGKRSVGEYVGFDGGDGFTYDSSNETWMRDLHKAGSFTIAMWVELVSGDNQRFMSTFSTAHGVYLNLATDVSGYKIYVGLTNSSGSVGTFGSAQPSLTGTFPRRMFWAASVVIGASSTSYTIMHDALAYTASASFSPSTTNAESTMRIASSGGGGLYPASGTKMWSFGLWTTALTADQMRALYYATRGRHSA